MRKLVKFTRSGAGIGFAYFEGDTVELEEKTANELMELGYVIPTTDEAASDLPEDLPFRKILIENGITSLEDLKKCQNLQEIKGIAAKAAKAIKEYLEVEN